MVNGGKATPLRQRLVLKAVKRGVTGLNGNFAVVTLLASCLGLGDERTYELSSAETGPREVRGLVQKGQG